MSDLARRWADDLAAWAIPSDILASAPESPWGIPVELFKTRDDPPPTPSRARALEALPAGGRVLDVGCGAGAASRPLAPPASRVIGVDESHDMLAAFASMAAVEHVEVLGRWPDVASQVALADVAVCHHVLYNVPDIETFVRALAEHASKRVVVEIFDEHPLAWMNPLWRDLHGIDRPDRPHAADAFAVIRELFPSARIERWQTNTTGRRSEQLDELSFAFLRRRLCVAPERDDELHAALERTPPPVDRTVATIWWSPS